MERINKKQIFIFSYIAFYFIWKTLAPLSINDLGSNVILSLGFLASSILIFGNFWKSGDYRIYTLFTGMAVLFYIFGDFLWVSYKMLYSVEPGLLHISSAFYALQGILFCIAAMNVIIRMSGRFERIESGADAFIIAGLVIYIAWKLFLGNAALTAIENPAERYVLFLYVFIDFVLIFSVSVISHIGRNDFADRLNSLALLIWCTTDIYYYWEYLSGTYTDSSYIDVFWLAAFFMIWYSLDYRVRNGLTDIIKNEFEPTSSHKRKSSSAAMKILFIIAMLLSYDDITAFALLSVLVIFRNVISRFMHTYLVNEHLTEEYRKLNEMLEEKVIERTEELKLKNRELKILAGVDELTGLPNRRQFTEKLESIIHISNDSTFFALMFIDLDRFKSINDWYGHEIGDRLLISAAQRFGEVLGKDGFLARLGGDEFVILIDSVTDVSGVLEISDRILKAFREPFYIGDSKIISTVSAGVSLFPKNGKDSSSLLRAADGALYSSKEKGRDCISLYTSSMKKKEKLRLEIESRLYDSIRNNEMEMTLSPVVRSNDMSISALQASVIWNNPVLGRMKQEDFSVIAEDSGFSIDIGRWLMHKACSAIAELAELSYSDLRVFIPVSERYFMGSDIVEEIRDNIIRYGISGSNLEIEITENFYPKDRNIMMEKLSELSRMGVRISVKDFGNGHASLSRLRSYPSDTLRISERITSGIVRERDSQLLAEAIVSAGRIFGKRITADGVSNARQAQMLRQFGCDEMQGAFFAKPSSLEEIREILDKSYRLP